MNQVIDDQLHIFSTAIGVERWEAAKKLMASREMAVIVQSKEFREGWRRIGDDASGRAGLEQLLAIDLLIRISAFVKKLRDSAVVAVRNALSSSIPPLVQTLTALPPDSKPAEIKENVASALEYATGDWVKDYIFSSFILEDRSQRCRDELMRRAAERWSNVDYWIDALLSNVEFDKLTGAAEIDARALRLREFLDALESVVRENKRTSNATAEVGRLLSDLCRRMVPLKKSDKIPSALTPAAIKASELLDDLVSMRPTLLVEPDIYAPLDVLRGWWNPLPYPKGLQTALAPIREKIRSAIVLRARLGQRSDELASRLVSAFGNQAEARSLLSSISDHEIGLSAEITDWLNGRTRTANVGTESAKQALRAVAIEDQTHELAVLMVKAWEATREAKGNPLLEKLAEDVIAAGNRQGLKLFWVNNEEMEYSGAAHETQTGLVPPEPIIRIVRPAVVRMRPGGLLDYVAKATVSVVQAN